MSRRDEAQPILSALEQAVERGNGMVRVPIDMASAGRDLIANLLDDLDEANEPRDERFDEAQQLLRDTARALLGPGDRDVTLLPDTARAIRDAASVAKNADINVLLQEISEGAKIYARPEYGPRSRWAALREEITKLQADLAAQVEATAASDDTLTQVREDLSNARLDLASEQIITQQLRDEMEKLTNRNTADGLALITLRGVINGAVWDEASQVWTFTDEQRKVALLA